LIIIAKNTFFSYRTGIHVPFIAVKRQFVFFIKSQCMMQSILLTNSSSTANGENVQGIAKDNQSLDIDDMLTEQSLANKFSGVFDEAIELPEKMGTKTIAAQLLSKVALNKDEAISSNDIDSQSEGKFNLQVSGEDVSLVSDLSTNKERLSPEILNEITPALSQSSVNYIESGEEGDSSTILEQIQAAQKIDTHFSTMEKGSENTHQLNNPFDTSNVESTLPFKPTMIASSVVNENNNAPLDAFDDSLFIESKGLSQSIELPTNNDHGPFAVNTIGSTKFDSEEAGSDLLDTSISTAPLFQSQSAALMVDATVPVTEIIQSEQVDPGDINPLTSTENPEITAALVANGQVSNSNVAATDVVDGSDLQPLKSEVPVTEKIKNYSADINPLTTTENLEMTAALVANGQVSNSNVAATDVVDSSDIQPLKSDKVAQLTVASTKNNTSNLMKEGVVNYINPAPQFSETKTTAEKIKHADITTPAAVIDKQVGEGMLKHVELEKAPAHHLGDSFAGRVADINGAGLNKLEHQSLQSAPTHTALQQALDLHAKHSAALIGERVLMMINQGKQEVNIRLDPAELGSMHIKLHMHKDQLNMFIQTDVSQSKDIIEQNLPKLREQLAQQGVNLGNTSVEQNARGQQQNQQNANSQGQSGSQHRENISTGGDLLSGNDEGIIAGTVKIPSSAQGIDYYA
jgi:flagellar hook-length control protein FliK